MTQQYDNTNRGVLFKDEEPKSEKSPQYTGTLNVAGIEFRLAAWVKESKAGNKFVSLAVTPKEEKKAETKPAGRIADMQDDIPF